MTRPSFLRLAGRAAEQAAQAARRLTNYTARAAPGPARN